MKKSIIIISMLCAASAAWAALVTDDFNRATTAQTGFTVNVGNTDWTQADDGLGTASADWFLNGNQIFGRNRTSNALMYNTALQTVSGGGESFTLSADVMSRNASVWSGVVFNYQDVNNYYMLRIKGDATDYQLLQNAGGSLEVLVNLDLSTGTFAQDVYYTMTIDSTTAGAFDFTITEQGSSTVLNAVTSGTDGSGILTSGFAGVYLSAGTLTNNAQFDNFSLEVIPEPATLGLMGLVGATAIFIRKRFMI